MPRRLPREVCLPEGWQLEITRKRIKHIYFRADLYRKVFRLSVPLRIREEELTAALRSKAGWMASRAAAPAMPKLMPSTLKETCLFRGQWYPVSVRQDLNGPAGVMFDPAKGVEIRVGAGMDPGPVLTAWYRETLCRDVERLITRWQPVLGVRVREFRIRKMKTRWGSCNTRAARVWINMALICLDSALLEYVVVHELVHLVEPSHGRRFYLFLDRYLPDWRNRKALLAPHAAGLA